MARDAEGKVGKFTAQNMSNTLLAYAKLEHHPGHLMEVMAAEALRKLETFTPQVQTLESHVRGTFCASSAMPGHQHIYTDRLAPAIALANRMSIQASLLQMSSDVVVEKYFFPQAIQCIQCWASDMLGKTAICSNDVYAHRL